MNRRFFLTWLGLGFLASTSLSAIAAIAHQQEEHSTANSSASVNTIRFYVACNGDDRWTGTKETPDLLNQDGPFATLHRAQAAIGEAIRQQGGLQQPVTVLVRGGTYFLSEPLKFAPEDSGTKDFPITYQAYPGEQPVISGGKAIAGEWQREGDIWTTNLPEVRAGKWYFRLLRINNDWATRARYPNESQNLFAKSWLYAKPARPKPVAMKQGNFNSGVGRIHNRGDRLEWNISVPASGKYRVWLRYSNNMQAYGLKSMAARTSLKAGNNPSVLLKNLPDTGSFETFRWQLVAWINLNAGEQKLVWQNLKGGGLGLDAFALTDDPNWNPVGAIAIGRANKAQIKPVKPGKHLIIVHAETFTEVSAKELTIFPEQYWRTHLTTAPDRFFDWESWSEAEIHVFPDRGWVNAILPVDEVDPATNTIYVKSQQDLKPGNRFFIANTREALDSPNEWYLDRTGKLHYYPTNPQFPQNTEIVAPRLDRLIVLQGDFQKQKYVENVHFVGLTFSDTNYTLASNYYFPADAAIWFSAARECSIRKCSFCHLGGYGVRLQDRSDRNSIIANSMTQLGQGGIVLFGNTDTQPYDNLIAANKIGEGGKVYKHVAGVYVTTGSGNRIAHNHIYQMPRYGISLKSLSNKHYSHNNIIEFNQIIDTCLETSDTGAIETLGRDRQASGNIIRYNFIRNVVGMGTTKQGQIVSPHYTWGIYLDDYSSGTVVYGNIVINTVLGGVMIHGGRNNLIQNNIFVNGSKSQIQVSPKDEFMAGNSICRNIFIYARSDAILWKSNKNWRANSIKVSDFNWYWHTGSIDLARTNKEITPEGNFVQWQDAGFDRHSLFAEPPFLNAFKHELEQIRPEDFAFDRERGSVKQLIQPIPVARIGISGFEQ